MLNLYRAEWRKALANYKLVSFLVWILPIGFFAFYAVMIIASLFVEAMEAGVVYFGSGDWTIDSLSTWDMMVNFPSNLFARLLPLAFMAVVIAGEYNWRTWKNVVPHAQRWKLILAKLAALVSLVMLSLMLTALISAFGPLAGHQLHGLAYGPAITLPVIQNFLLETVRTVFITTLTLTVLAGYASLAAILTRSILGGLMAGFAVSVLDNVALPLFKLLGFITNRPTLVNLYQYTPSYNLSNMQSWLLQGRAVDSIIEGVSMLGVTPGFWVSTTIITIWICGLTGLAILLFQRQDLTE